MKDIIVCPLKKDERRRFFEFARNLPERDFWGKKSRLLRGDFKRFQKIFEYIEPFQPRRFLIAEEDNKIVGFIVAVYNPNWMNDLKKRCEYNVEKRAYILGVAVVQQRKDILNALIDDLTDYFSKKGVESVEYPTLGNTCLTTATDILTPENVDALIMFREAGFKTSECYYSMKLNLDSYKDSREHPLVEGTFQLKKRSIRIVQENEVLGRVTWEPVKNEKTSLGIYVERAYRGKGLGYALMAAALHQLKNENIKSLELGVDGNNLPALKLYRKFGFKVHMTHFYILVHC